MSLSSSVLGAEQLRAMGVKLSDDGYVRTVRILPGRIDKALIPPHILRHLREYTEEGEHLSNEKRRTLRNILRRYHLIEPPNRLRWEGLPNHLQKLQRRRYNKQWYRRTKSKATAKAGHRSATRATMTELGVMSKRIDTHNMTIVE